MNLLEIITALRAANVSSVSVSGGKEVYAYLDGPGTSLVASEWLLTFGFESEVLTRFTIEKRLIGP